MVVARRRGPYTRAVPEVKAERLVVVLEIGWHHRTKRSERRAHSYFRIRIETRQVVDRDVLDGNVHNLERLRDIARVEGQNFRRCSRDVLRHR